MKKNIKFILILLLTTLIIMTPRLSDGIFSTGADGRFHASIIQAYRDMFEQHIFFSNGILPNIGGNLGYGTALFYPTFIHYTSGFIAYLIPSEYDVYYAMDIVYFFNFFFASFTMFMLSKKLFNNNFIALISGIIYTLTPYHLAQIYTCDAYAQIWLFVFLPLVFIGIYYLIKQNHKLFYFYFIIGIVGCLYSHMMSSFYLAILSLIIISIFYFKTIFHKNNIKPIIISCLIILGLTAPLYFNLIYFKFFGNYQVFLPGHMVLNGIENTFIPPELYIYHDPSKAEQLLDYSINLPVVISCLISISFIKKYKNKKIILFLFSNIIILLFLFSTYSPLKLIPNFFEILQSISRLTPLLWISVSLFAPLFLTKININNLIKILLIFIFIFFGFKQLRYLQNDLEKEKTMYVYNTKKEELIPNITLLPETLEELKIPSNSLGHQKEYMPVGYNCDDFIKRNQEGIKILQGNADINIINNNVPDLTFTISNQTTNTIIELPRIYYDGYVLTKDNQIIDLKQSVNGFVSFEGNNLNGTYQLTYKGTIFQKLSKIIRILTIIIILIIILIKRKNKS